MAFEVTEIAYYYHYATEYICEHTSIWRKMMLNRIKFEKAQRMDWELDRSLLSHTPGTQDGADEMKLSVKEIRKRTKNQIMLALGMITEEDIRRAEIEEDGKMMRVE